MNEEWTMEMLRKNDTTREILARFKVSSELKVLRENVKKQLELLEMMVVGRFEFWFIYFFFLGKYFVKNKPQQQEIEKGKK